jgi:hypothetical protein
MRSWNQEGAGAVTNLVVFLRHRLMTRVCWSHVARRLNESFVSLVIVKAFVINALFSHALPGEICRRTSDDQTTGVENASASFNRFGVKHSL